MSKRSFGRLAEVLGGLGLFALLAACSSNAKEVAFTTPGWYLEKPRLISIWGPQLFGGPFTYDQCEAERMKLPQTTSDEMLCVNELVKPGKYGPY
ncbi:hypothetical protein SAMN02745126_00374 [Enhydrobacter aerosaccus]|uniref:Uncharacterized protein n=1 Tax=Enhydrobacter aerosaccus TaxID=225324 RepID=A0A1T4JRC0_9HYPH|nr:hypothetical protein [Enhydrobacter aerosaccus]SJZ32674.1 hypothetical protein SAMN02745126_00374 [Enhydrobacter aerosaccus]